MNVSRLFAASQTKRAYLNKSVRDKEIFFDWRTVFAGSPLLEVFNSRRHP